MDKKLKNILITENKESAKSFLKMESCIMLAKRLKQLNISTQDSILITTNVSSNLLVTL